MTETIEVRRRKRKDVDEQVLKDTYVCTVESPNNGHAWGPAFCPLYRGCPTYLGGWVLLVFP